MNRFISKFLSNELIFKFVCNKLLKGSDFIHMGYVHDSNDSVMIYNKDDVLNGVITENIDHVITLWVNNKYEYERIPNWIKNVFKSYSGKYRIRYIDIMQKLCYRDEKDLPNPNLEIEKDRYKKEHEYFKEIKGRVYRYPTHLYFSINKTDDGLSSEDNGIFYCWRIK